jgi:hypothetical protein
MALTMIYLNSGFCLVDSLYGVNLSLLVLGLFFISYSEDGVTLSRSSPWMRELRAVGETTQDQGHRGVCLTSKYTQHVDTSIRYMLHVLGL